MKLSLPKSFLGKCQVLKNADLVEVSFAILYGLLFIALADVLSGPGVIFEYVVNL